VGRRATQDDVPEVITDAWLAVAPKGPAKQVLANGPGPDA
jgi:hypothetical protein